jgi:hypothetical protein
LRVGARGRDSRFIDGADTWEKRSIELVNKYELVGLSSIPH